MHLSFLLEKTLMNSNNKLPIRKVHGKSISYSAVVVRIKIQKILFLTLQWQQYLNILCISHHYMQVEYFVYFQQVFISVYVILLIIKKFCCLNAYQLSSLALASGHTAWHEILRVLIFAIFPAIRKNKFPQIKITANNFPAKIYSRVNIL